MPKVAKEKNDIDYDEKIAQYKKDLQIEAERLVTKEFPKRVFELDSLVEDKFSLANIQSIGCQINIPKPEDIPVTTNKSQSGAPPAKKQKRSGSDQNAENCEEVEGTKVFYFINGSVPSNSELVDLMEIVKPVVREAVESVNKIKMWISYLIPRIEDGNNFGVSIQEDTLAEVRTVEAEAASFLDQISRYLLQRGRLVCKIAKYPHVDDYRRSIVDMDQKQYLNLRLAMMELRNHYGTLHDVITKNLEKIKTPRSNNTGHLY